MAVIGFIGTAAHVNISDPQYAETYPVLLGETASNGHAAAWNNQGRAVLARADQAARQQFRGVLVGRQGGAMSLVKRGRLGGYDVSALDYDAPVYLSDTPGAFDTAPGLVSVRVGRVVPASDPQRTKLLYIEADWLRQWT